MTDRVNEGTISQAALYVCARACELKKRTELTPDELTKVQQAVDLLMSVSYTTEARVPLEVLLPCPVCGKPPRVYHGSNGDECGDSVECDEHSVRTRHGGKEQVSRCRDSLDTGWECTGCGYDAQPIALSDANT